MNTAVLKGVLEEHGEEDAEECQHEDTTLFDSATDEEGLRCCTTETMLRMLSLNEVTSASSCRGRQSSAEA